MRIVREESRCDKYKTPWILVYRLVFHKYRSVQSVSDSAFLSSLVKRVGRQPPSRVQQTELFSVSGCLPFFFLSCNLRNKLRLICTRNTSSDPSSFLMACQPYWWSEKSKSMNLRNWFGWLDLWFLLYELVAWFTGLLLVSAFIILCLFLSIRWIYKHAGLIWALRKDPH